MEATKVIYKIKTAIEQEICLHLKECDANFSPPLSNRINIEEYSKKIKQNAITFEAWSENSLIGLVAVYIDLKENSTYITNVSVLKKHLGLGIATQLLTRCIEYVKQNNFERIKLEVFQNNSNAINLYKKFNFIKYDSKNDFDLMKLEI